MNIFANPRRALFLLFILIVGTVCKADDTPVSQTCSGEPVPLNVKDSNPVAVDSLPQPHTIKLTWRASVPASSAKRDEVAGYLISRHEGGKSCEKGENICETLNPLLLIRETSCIDYQVQPGHKYTYQARAVAANKKVSSFSKEVTAKAR